jgi:multimeric flavodoxin WrbA
MKITILNGNPDGQDAQFEGYLAQLVERLEDQQHQVTMLNLRQIDLRYCVGCFGCWV